MFDDDALCQVYLQADVDAVVVVEVNHEAYAFGFVVVAQQVCLVGCQPIEQGDDEDGFFTAVVGDDDIEDVGVFKRARGGAGGVQAAFGGEDEEVGLGCAVDRRWQWLSGRAGCWVCTCYLCVFITVLMAW